MHDILRFLSMLVYLYFFMIISFRIFIFIYFNFIYNKNDEDSRSMEYLEFAEQHGLKYDKIVPKEIEKSEFNDPDITDALLRFPLYRPFTHQKFVNYISGFINDTKFISNERIIFAPKTLWFQQIYILKNNKIKIPSFNFRMIDFISDYMFNNNSKISFSEDPLFSKKYVVFENANNKIDSNCLSIKDIFNQNSREILTSFDSFFISINGSKQGEIKIVITKLTPQNDIELIFKLVKSMFNQQI